mmetsp:Transcript_23488/g.27732  ORF Transcript_23488/g.27732 Transcript_23488/m.27732 type:complete len:329 (-) Transcript_23488:66-1052(-)
MSRKTENSIVVAICAATGNQGKEVIRRFNEINNDAQINGTKIFECRALTRNASSEEAKKLGKNPHVTVAETDYSSVESLRKVLKNVDALYLNYALVKNEAEIEKLIIDVAIESEVKHIVYASTVSQKNHGVPHWASCSKTEQHLEEYLSKTQQDGHDFKYHLIKLAHFNENILPGSYFPPKKGKLTYPWRSNARFATSSLRDAARVACKLIVEPAKLENGGSVDALTELVTVDDIAKDISKATGNEVLPTKGPWIFTKFGHWFGWQASSILSMAKYIDAHGFVDGINFNEMTDFLEEEIKAGEPLETVGMFAYRHFGKKIIWSQTDRE